MKVHFPLIYAFFIYLHDYFLLTACLKHNFQLLKPVIHSHFTSLKSQTVSTHDRVDIRDSIMIFGRLADKELLLDVEGAGTPEMANCCHGGCDNCNYSRIFDSLSAGRAKWVALYTTRTLIDGRSHESPWAKIFPSEEAISKEEFVRRIQSLPYKPQMGPPSLPQEVSAEEIPSKEAVERLWGCGLEKPPDEMTPSQLMETLKRLTGEPHGALWSDFVKIFHGP
mmetsp:Transcript_22813/g.31288  ORF Transcript_22813/g.31288 Transcript_22813/m.31288 type:complete len:224 (-) Transcript_22813:72-743(-)